MLPHGQCFLWIPSILWTSVVADALIALAYLTIPVSLVYFIRKRRDMPFDWMFIAFGVFILACGSTHLADIRVVWHPDYVLSVTLKAITAVASVVTALAMVRLIPIALRIPSPAQLAAVNAELQQAIHDLRAAMERAEVASRAKSARPAGGGGRHHARACRAKALALRAGVDRGFAAGGECG